MNLLRPTLLVDFDYDLAARALSEAQAQHVESSQDAFERSRGGVSDVGAIEFDPFENTKKAISETSTGSFTSMCPIAFRIKRAAAPVPAISAPRPILKSVTLSNAYFFCICILSF